MAAFYVCCTGNICSDVSYMAVDTGQGTREAPKVKDGVMDPDKKEEGDEQGAARLSEELMNTPAPVFWHSQQEVKGSLGAG